MIFRSHLEVLHSYMIVQFFNCIGTFCNCLMHFTRFDFIWQVLAKEQFVHLARFLSCVLQRSSFLVCVVHVVLCVALIMFAHFCIGVFSRAVSKPSLHI